MTITIEVTRNAGVGEWVSKTLTLDDVEGHEVEDVLAVIAIFLGGGSNE